MERCPHRSPVADRSDDLQRQIELWVGEKKLADAMTREELAQLEGFQRVLVLRNGALCAAINYIQQNPRADATLAVMILIAFLCDNNDGLCRVGIKRMAEVFHRTERAIGDIIDRLERADRIGVNRPSGLAASYWIKVPKRLADADAGAARFVNALSSKPSDHARRYYQQPLIAPEPPKSNSGVPLKPANSASEVTPEVERRELPKSNAPTIDSSKGRVSKGGEEGEEQLALPARASLADEFTPPGGATPELSTNRRYVSGLCDIQAVIRDGKWCWGEEGLQYVIRYGFTPADVKWLFADWRDDRIKKGLRFKGQNGWWLDFQQWVRRQAKWRNERAASGDARYSRASEADIIDQAFSTKGDFNG
jgi:hypothetical protein